MKPYHGRMIGDHYAAQLPSTHAGQRLKHGLEMSKINQALSRPVLAIRMSTNTVPKEISCR